MKQFLLFLAGIFLATTLLRAESEWFGYYENRFFLISKKTIPWSSFNEKIELGDYNRLRLNFKASPATKMSVNLAIDIFSFHGVLTSPLGISTADTGAKTARIDPDRIYVDLHFKHFDLSLGKQRTALGVSYIWAPIDVFNRVNIFEPKEEKPGVNAAKLYVPLGRRTSLTGIFSPDDRFRSSTSALRAQTQLGALDAAITLIHRGEYRQTIYGADLRGENLIGWWVEYGYHTSPSDQYSKLVIGWDYTFPIKKGLYWLNEYFHDGSGERNPERYDYTRLLSQERFILARHYFLSLLRYTFNEFWQATISYIGNWTDGSFLLSPAIQYDPFPNGSLTCGGYFPCGDRQGELNRGGRNMIFLWLKIHF